MAADQAVVGMGRIETSVSPRGTPPSAGRGRNWGKGLLVLLVLAGLGAGGYYLFASDRERGRSTGHTGASEHGTAAAHAEEGSGGSGLPRVEVVRPKRGGMEMTTN